MTARILTPAQRARKREYELGRWNTTTQGIIKRDSRIVIPEDVERHSTHAPCFPCGVARGPCKHRPWA